jgi:Predicted Zn peptidase
MISIEDTSVFEQYYQASYDFNTSSLNEEEIDDIKTLATEKRVNYALAPIGEKIFEFITEQYPNIFFELVDLENDEIDGMLYIPKRGEEKAYIILNGNKPFINQIFAAAHEYYHYIKDYESIKEKPYICCLSSLNNLNEKKASRFAAELLLPSAALEKEMKFIRKRINLSSKKKFGFEEYAALCMILTLKYKLPLKAVIYRLHEEEYIDNVDEYIKKYEFIKNVLMEAEIVKSQINQLYSNRNEIIDSGSIIYKQIQSSYNNGLASREEIIEDADKLQLNKELIESFFDKIEDEDEDEEDFEIRELVKKKWGGGE